MAYVRFLKGRVIEGGESFSFDMSFRRVDRTGPEASIYADLFVPFENLGPGGSDSEIAARRELLSYLKKLVAELESELPDS